MQRWDIINYLIKKNNYKSYLEIGYYKGWSFDQVQCDFKTAVDPNPCKTPEQEKAIGGLEDRSLCRLMHNGDHVIRFGEFIWKMTSDNFFVEISYDATYDIIFIDGLHESAQVSRDIQNALKHLNPGGVIVMHDCNPSKYEHTTTGIDGCWTGDTYKAFIRFQEDTSCIIDFPSKSVLFSDYEVYVIDTDWGIGIIKPFPEEKSRGITSLYEGKWDVETAQKDWEYFDKNRKELLNLISVEEFLEREK